MTSTSTPLRSMIPIDRSPSARVLDTSGERFSVQLMKSAVRSEKSHLDSLASCSWRSGRVTDIGDSFRLGGAGPEHDAPGQREQQDGEQAGGDELCALG